MAEGTSNTGTAFYSELVSQLRGIDQWGSWDKFTDEQIVERKFIKTKEQLKKIPRGEEMDPLVLGSIRIFLQGAAQAIEKSTGILCQVVVDINDEAFGRGLVIGEGLVLAERFFREAHRFSFQDVETLKKEGQSMVDKAVANFEKFRPCM